MSNWLQQLTNSFERRYEQIPKHGGGFTPGRQGAIMLLTPHAALEVLRRALYDPAAAAGLKAPSLWGYSGGTIYRFMWDNQNAWHGYPVQEMPPNFVLQTWRANGTISEAEFGKIRKYPGRGN